MNTEDAQTGFDGGPAKDRRLRPRIPLRAPLTVRRGRETAVLSALTENLSSRGFCGTLESPLAPGDLLECVIRLPLRVDAPAAQALRCNARVVWVMTLADGRCRAGCAINEYTVVP